MNCPVCKTKFDFPSLDLEEFYYDCPHCNSSLLFKNGDYKILSQGKVEPEKSESENPPEDSSEEIKENTKQELLEEPVESIPKNQKKKPENPVESASENQEQEPENSQEEVEVPDETEEEFIPDETSHVPELSSPEEETSENKSGEEDPVAESEQEDQQNREEAPLEEEKDAPDNFSSEKDFSFTEELEEPLQKETETESQKEDFSEVAEFGNTKDQDQQGPFIYDLTLKEINSQELREKVLEVLNDEYLNLPEDSSIKDGQITLTKISPVQAYVIVTSLMGLPLQISWKQQHIADSSTNE